MLLEYNIWTSQRPAIVLYQQIPLNAEIDDEKNHINQHTDFRKYLNRSLLLNKKKYIENSFAKKWIYIVLTHVLFVFNYFVTKTIIKL